MPLIFISILVIAWCNSKAAKQDVFVSIRVSICLCMHVCALTDQVAQLWQRPRELGDFKRVGQFEAKFEVEVLHFAPPCMDC